MKIELTEKEYRILVEAIELADWVIHAHDDEDRKTAEGFRKLEQKILAHAKDFGMEEDVIYDQKVDEYCYSQGIEDKIMAVVDEYNNNTFWDELMDRLVIRDLVNQVGEKGYNNLSFEEKWKKEDPIREKYEEEFSRYGIDRLGVKP